MTSDNKEITKTKQCFKKVSQIPLEFSKNIMRVNNETEISKLGFQIANKLDRNRSDLVEVMAMGPATVKVVKVVELLKRVLADIHISVDIVDAKFEETYEPLYEGL